MTMSEMENSNRPFVINAVRSSRF